MLAKSSQIETKQKTSRLNKSPTPSQTNKNRSQKSGKNSCILYSTFKEFRKISKTYCSAFSTIVFLVFSKVPGDVQDINTFEGSSSSGNGLINVRTSLTENSVLNGSPSPTNANGISFIRSASNGDVGMDITDNGISVSSNGDVLNSEKSVLIEDIVQTLRETYERMPAHLLQYELAKAKALLSVKFT